MEVGKGHPTTYTHGAGSYLFPPLTEVHLSETSEKGTSSSSSSSSAFLLLLLLLLLHFFFFFCISSSSSSSSAFMHDSALNGQSGGLDEGCGIHQVFHVAQLLFLQLCSISAAIAAFLFL